MQWLLATALFATLSGCVSTQPHVVLSDGTSVIATATNIESTSSPHHRGISYHTRTFQLDGLGELSFDGKSCILVVDRPRFGAFRFYSPKCSLSIETEQICIGDVVLHDDLAALEKLPSSLHLRGCARQLPPPVVVAAEPSKPPEPRQICEPIMLFHDQRRIASVVVVSSSKALEAKQQPSGDWAICYWGLPMDSYSYQVEYVLDDGGTGSIMMGGRTFID